MACMFYFAHCISIIFNSLLVQHVKYDVHITRKIKFVHAICYPILFACTGLHHVVQSNFYCLSNVLYDGNWVMLYIRYSRIWHDPVIFPVIGPSVLSAANQNT